MKALKAFSILFLLLCSTAATARAETYNILDLGTLVGDAESYAYGLNDDGKVVGYSKTSGGVEHAFLYTGSEPMQDLNTLGGTNSRAYGINNSGVIVGYSQTTGNTAEKAFRYDVKSGMLPMNTLGGVNSHAYSINDSGQIVGWSDITGGGEGGVGGTGATHAFLYDSNSMVTDLHNFGLGGTNSYAYAINADGKIAGYSQTEQDAAKRAFLYDGTQMINLGVLNGGTNSYGSGINSLGNVVGWSEIAGSATHAFLYTGGPLQDLGVLNGGTNSHAYGINSFEKIVGWSEITGGDKHAFIYDTTMSDLNDLLVSGSGWTLQEARAINELGQIVGWGLHDNIVHAFLLTPVPEPGTLVLLGIGVVGFIAFSRQRRLNS
jgi:probable HAF family extracellular repeat protein